MIRPGTETRGARIGFLTLATGSALYLFSQAVWNVGPVIATGRTADGMLAAAFAASAVLLRAPVMAFPAVQALMLPRLAAADPDTVPRRSPLLVTGAATLAAVWVVGSMVVSPPIIRVLFAMTETPGNGVLAALAISVAIGLVIQGTQTRLLAAGRTVLVSASWAIGTALLIAFAVLVPDAVVGAAVGQLGAAIVVLGIQWTGLTRRRRTL